MRTKNELNSITSLTNIKTVIFGGAFFGIIGAIITIHSNGSAIVLGGPFMLIGVYTLYLLYSFDNIFISNGDLILKSITGNTKKTIPLSEFESYAEINNWSGIQLTLISKNYRYKIASYNYFNYEHLRNSLIVGLEQNTIIENKYYKKKRIGYILVGIGLLFAGYYLYNNGFPAGTLFILLFSFGVLLWVLGPFRKDD